MNLSYIRGWVLAGGAGSRMGQEKSALLLGEQTLLEIAVDKVRSICGNAMVLCGSDPQRAKGIAEAIVDTRSSCGPLGGIEAALQRTDAEWNLFLAVDTPLIPCSLLRAWIREVLSRSGVGAAVISDDERAHALPLLLRRETLPQLSASLDAGRYRLLEEMRASVAALGMSMSITDADSLIPCPSDEQREARPVWFANGNTPGEIERMRRFAHILRYI